LVDEEVEAVSVLARAQVIQDQVLAHLGGEIPSYFYVCVSNIYAATETSLLLSLFSAIGKNKLQTGGG
jgi:hypothetical protein